MLLPAHGHAICFQLGSGAGLGSEVQMVDKVFAEFPSFIFSTEYSLLQSLWRLFYDHLSKRWITLTSGKRMQDFPLSWEWRREVQALQDGMDLEAIF